MSATQELPFDEAVVRRLCGPAVFAAADALQRDGHVLSMLRSGDVLRARVRGTWRRIDEATVRSRGKRLEPHCSRHGAVYCRHVGALMLAAVRSPMSIALAPAITDEDDDTAVTTSGAIVDRATLFRQELEGLLQHLSVPNMRQLAQRRDIKLSGNQREVVTRQLVAGLTDPDNIDAALAKLSQRNRLALDAIHVATFTGSAPAPMILLTFQALGGKGQVPLAELEAVGVIFPIPSEYSYGWHAGHEYLMPSSVITRLKPVDTLVRRATEAQMHAERSAEHGLGMNELILVLASEARAGHLTRNGAIGMSDAQMQDMLVGAGADAIDDEPYDELDEFDEYLDDDGLLYGAFQDPLEVAAQATPDPNPVVVVPPNWLADNVSDRLSKHIGIAPEKLNFTVQLMLSLGILTTGDSLALREDRVEALMNMPSGQRTAILTNAWFAVGTPELLSLVFGEHGRLHLVLPSYHWHAPIQNALSDIVRLVMHLLGRMAPDWWYDADALVELTDACTKIVAAELNHVRTWSGDAHAYALYLRRRRGVETPLILREQDDWLVFLTAVIDALLTGPAQWLGYVATTSRDNSVVALQVQPLAGLLVGRAVQDETQQASEPPVVTADLQVVLSTTHGHIDIELLRFLSKAGELASASPRELRYQITATGAHALFNAGWTPAELVGYLTSASAKPVPKPVVAQINEWWSSFGTVRLYDELALVELSDDLLLPELLAAARLKSFVVHQFSPRLIAVDPEQVTALVAELTARGYTPRVIEDAG